MGHIFNKEKKSKTRRKDRIYGRIPSKFVYSVVYYALYFAFKKIFRIKFNVDERIAGLKGPTIILANHPSNIDPFCIGFALYPSRINFLASSYYFRNPISRAILYFSGAIPKMQFRADPRAVKSMLKVVKRGGLLGIFPEGSRSIDGTTMKMEDAIAKFVKKSKANVVTAISKGAYLSWPRWTKSSIRRGRVELDIKLIMDRDEVEGTDLESLNKKVAQSISYNEYEWQKKNCIKFSSLAPARGLHNILHKCPSCLKDWTTQSSKNILRCTNCNNTAVMDNYGFLSPANGNCKVFETVHDWNMWQKEKFTENLKEKSLMAKARLYVAFEDKSYKYAGRGTVYLNKNIFGFDGTIGIKKYTKSFPIGGILGISARYGKHFDIVEDNITYRFKLKFGQKTIGFAHALDFLRSDRNK